MRLRCSEQLERPFNVLLRAFVVTCEQLNLRSLPRAFRPFENAVPIAASRCS
jgi:hypothetical protein